MGNGPTPPPTVNAPAEERRLQENEALGQPVTQGATPQNSNANRGLLRSSGEFLLIRRAHADA